MRAYDVIEKKRNGEELNLEEIKFFINGYVEGNIPDYQMSALLMAIYIKGMSNKECEFFTETMLNSGDRVDLSSINGIKVDKHSTGGVGDKTTLIITPIVASCGVKVAKMSGRGLGHTGGTIDKLESIKGVEISLDNKRFFEIVNSVGCCVVGQTGNLVPADKKIYALRDVTATVESIPLIASSIMSKKLASGADCILLDVKAGDGAFMKTTDDAIELSKIMVDIGEKFGKKVTAVITDMDVPLGYAIGNFTEVWESCEVLKGHGPKDLREISIYLASYMLFMAGIGTLKECKKMAENSITSGRAFEKFKEMISAQGGDTSVLEGDNYINKSEVIYECVSDIEGYITSMEASKLGKAAMILGAGRQTKEESVDPYAGIVLNKKVGDSVQKGELIATLYSSNNTKCKEAEIILKDALKISNVQYTNKPLIRARVNSDGLELYSIE